MKSILLGLALSTLAACGAAGQDSSVAANGVPTSLSFVADLRPVDGNRHEITVTATADGKYNLKSLVSGHPRGGQESSRETGLIDGAACQFAFDGAVLKTVVCMRDLRMVDGARIEISIVRQQDGRYDAFRNIKAFNRIENKPVNETTEIGFGLKRVK